MCNLSKMEDEKHFLITCPAYTSEREKLFSVAKEHTGYTCNYDDQQWLIWLLTNENKTVCKAVGTYVHNCFELRKQHINNAPPLNRNASQDD